MEEKQKKSRSANYTPKEKELLISLVENYKEIIENKKTDGSSVSEKISAWKDIETQFNIAAPNMCFRNWESLKKMFENQKKELRKKVAEQKKELYLTGGGPCSKEIKDEFLLNIIGGKTVLGLNNSFDSDSLKFKTSSLKNKDILFHQADSNNENCELDVLSEKENIGELLTEVNEPIGVTPKTIHSINYGGNILKKSISEGLRTSATVSSQFQEGENNIELIYDTMNTISENLKKPKIQSASGVESTKIASRRRPRSTIQVTSASTLHDKYEKLVEMKIVNEDFLIKESHFRMESMKRKYNLEIEALKLDIEIKKKHLEAMEH